MNKDFFLDERIQRGLKQREVAKALNLHYSWISRVERDWTKGNYSTLIALASFYEIGADKCAEIIREKKQIKGLTKK